MVSLFAFNSMLKQYLYRRDAVKTVQEILHYLKIEDLTQAARYWEDKKNFVPMYELTSSKIKNKKFYTEAGMLHAEFIIALEFPAGNLLPSGEDWILKLKKSESGWEVVEFYLVKTDALPAPR